MRLVVVFPTSIQSRTHICFPRTAFCCIRTSSTQIQVMTSMKAATGPPPPVVWIIQAVRRKCRSSSSGPASSATTTFQSWVTGNAVSVRVMQNLRTAVRTGCSVPHTISRAGISRSSTVLTTVRRSSLPTIVSHSSAQVLQAGCCQRRSS